MFFFYAIIIDLVLLIIEYNDRPIVNHKIFSALLILFIIGLAVSIFAFFVNKGKRANKG
jgi:hypothetical protein